ncbi:HTH domain-containing protein [Halalkalibacter sp. APA_J-10(15)]|uniref:HTH domain-containing protein n=1 Tax=Halalkalibacter sp. APA_J-10(15) TaxID=2933805 RepID=UPI001FF5F118|nr:HTH domain-containing protein [Halalkalibacter sp. APA_J-10(15)]
MTKKYFTEKEVNDLLVNPNVKSVSDQAITYTDEFRRLFISESEKGKFPRQIFEENGFNSEVVGSDRIRKTANRWRTTYKKSGVMGLSDSRSNTSGRPLQRELTLQDKNRRLEAQVHLLRAENELLKKLEMIERGLGRSE